MPAHLSCHVDYSPLLIDSFILSPSLSLSACLLFCFVLPSVHIENQRRPSLPINRFLSCSLLCSVTTVVRKRSKCEQFRAGNHANKGSPLQHCFVSFQGFRQFDSRNLNKTTAPKILNLPITDINDKSLAMSGWSILADRRATGTCSHLLTL